MPPSRPGTIICTVLPSAFGFMASLIVGLPVFGSRPWVQLMPSISGMA